MFQQSSRIMTVQEDNFDISANPQENNLSKSKFQSPSLKIGNIQYLKFIYHSPGQVQNVQYSSPLTFSNHAHNHNFQTNSNIYSLKSFSGCGFRIPIESYTFKQVVTKPFNFHNQILEKDPLKNSKIIENINHLREQKHRVLDITNNRTSAQNSKVYNSFLRVSRVLVDVKASRNPSQLRINRSLSCSCRVIDCSRRSVIQGLKSGNSLYQSMVKVKQDSLVSSRASELKIDQIKNRAGLAQSRYLSGIITK